MTGRRPRRAGQRGQAVVLLAVGGVAMMAMAGLALDAGFEAGQFRIAQNAADAAALQVANQIFGAEIKHTPPPTLDQMEQTADKVIVENKAVPGRVSGGGGAGSGGSGSGSSTPPPAVTPLPPGSLPPVWMAGSSPSADAAMAFGGVTATASTPGVVVTDSVFAGHSTIASVVPDPATGVVPNSSNSTTTVDLGDNNVSETDPVLPPTRYGDSLSCSEAQVGVPGTSSCTDSAPIPLPAPLTISDIGTVDAQTPQAGTDAAGNPLMSGMDDLTNVDFGQLGIATITGDVYSQTVVAANHAMADVSLISPTVYVNVPGVATLNLSVPWASITDTVGPVGSGAYHLQQVWCGVGGTLTVTPAGGSPVSLPVPADCDVGSSLPPVPDGTVSVTAGTTDPLPGVACTLGVVCEAGIGCIEHIVVSSSDTGVGANICLGRADATSTLVAAATASTGTTSGTTGSTYTPSSAADNGVSVDAYINSPTFFLKVLGLSGSQPTATASAQIQSVSDVPDALFTASNYAMPMFATRMDGTSHPTERLTPGHEYYLWGGDMCTDSPMAWCSLPGSWGGQVTAKVAGQHAVNSVLLPQTGVGNGPVAYGSTTGYLLMPVMDATGTIRYYDEFSIDGGNPHQGTLVNSDPAFGGHLVQAPSTGAYNPYDDGAATIRLTN